MSSFITKTKVTMASIPNAAAGKINEFVDSSDGVTKSKDDTGTIVVYSAGAAVAAHEAAIDPHPQYETSAEAQSKVDAHANLINNPHAVTKTQIGLSNVDNTSDVNKPISTATQTALNLKYDASNPTGYQTAAQVTTSVNGAITAHEALLNPHPNYATDSDLTSGLALKYDATNPNGYETPAQLNARDTANRDRTNHTGTQLKSTISDFAHTHTLSELTQSGATSGQVATWNGSAWVPLDPGGDAILRTTIVQSVATVTPTTLTQLTSLSLAVGFYEVTAHLLWQSTATTTGVGFRLQPVTATLGIIHANFNVSQAAAGTDRTFDYQQVLNADNVTATAALTANANFTAKCFGILEVTAAGTIAMQMRSETGTSVSIRPGSVMILKKVG